LESTGIESQDRTRQPGNDVIGMIIVVNCERSFIPTDQPNSMENRSTLYVAIN
jgi:hypothetical protein